MEKNYLNGGNKHSGKKRNKTEKINKLSAKENLKKQQNKLKVNGNFACFRDI